IRPSSGRSKPAISRRVVVLPEPEGPSIVKNSPRAMSRSIPSTATTSPNVFRTPVRTTSRAASEVAASSPLTRACAGVDKRLLQDRKRGGAGHRVAAERAAQTAGRDRVHHLCPPGHTRERQPAAERLAGDQQVGLDPVVLDGPDGARAPHPGLHLVVDVENPV